MRRLFALDCLDKSRCRNGLLRGGGRDNFYVGLLCLFSRRGFLKGFSWWARSGLRFSFFSALVEFAPLLVEPGEAFLSVLAIGVGDLQGFFQLAEAFADFFMLFASGLKFHLAAGELASGIDNILRKILERCGFFGVRLFRLKQQLLEFGFFHRMRFELATDR